MAKRPVLQDVTSRSDYTNINTNFERIEEAWDNLVSRDGSVPNYMEADLDLNSNDILNAKQVDAQVIKINGRIVNDSTFGADPGEAYFSYPTVADLLASTANARGVGAIWEGGGFRYEEVSSGEHVTTAGGVKLYVLPIWAGADGGIWPVAAFGFASGATAAANTTAGQAAIDAAQADSGQVWFPSGIFDTNGWTYNGNFPLSVTGCGRSSFSGSPPAVIERSTVFNLKQSNGYVFHNSTGANSGFQKFADFSAVNDSGAKGTTAVFYSENLVFTEFDRISASGFKYGIRAQWSIYLAFRFVEIRDTDYPFDLTNINKTPPLVLNQIGANGFFNNAITMDNCSAIDCIDGYRLAGVSIHQRACDATRCSGIGWVIGGTDYNLTQFEGSGLYSENGTGVAINATNADLNIGQIFFGTNSSKGIKATSSKVTVQQLRSYATVTVGVESVDSEVSVFSWGGTFTTRWTHSGTGFVRFIADEYEGLSAATITNGNNTTVTINSNANRSYIIPVYGRENGTTDFSFIAIVKNDKCYTIGTVPSNLAPTAAINGNGNYDLRLSNTAGFAYTFQIEAKPAPLHYTVPL